MTVLDQFRDGGTAEPPRTSSPRVADVLAARHRPTAALATPTRAAAWGLATTTTLASFAEFLLTPQALSAVGVEEGPLAFAVDLLLWPTPFLQPALLALVGAVVFGIAFSSRGFHQVTSPQSVAIITLAVVGAATLVPAVIVVAGIALIAALGAAVVALVFVVIISMVADL
jgi:hypothetical protein